MDLSLPSFLSIETSSSIRRDFIRLDPEIRNSLQDKPLRLSVGTLEMDKLAGWLRTVGVNLGGKMDLRNLFSYFRCVLVNQDELQIEKFTIAPALNTEDIEQIEQGE
jgi:hypothetical protein